MLQPTKRPSIWDAWLFLFEGGRGTLLALVLAPLLLFLALWLPPLSLGDRLLLADYSTVTAQGGTLTDPSGARLTVLPEGLTGTTHVRFSRTPQAALIEGQEGPYASAAQALPPYLVLKSDLYEGTVRGPVPQNSAWMLPLDESHAPYSLLDMYQWDGSSWRWLPHHLWPLANQIEGRAEGVPPAVALVQAQWRSPRVTALAGESGDFIGEMEVPPDINLSQQMFLVQGDGTIGQLYMTSPQFQSGSAQIPVLHNVEGPGVVRSDWVNNMLIDPNMWRDHIQYIESVVARNEYEGIVVDYRGVDPALRDAFSAFVTELGTTLSANNQLLVVRVGEPVRISEDSFDTAGYDWETLGRVAMVQVPLPRATPLDLEGLRVLLNFATGQVDRYRLQIELPSAPYRMVSGAPEPIDIVTLRDSLIAASNRAPSDVSLDGLVAAGIVEGDVTQGYTATLDGESYFVEDETTVQPRLALLNEYAVGGVVLADAPFAERALWDILPLYRNNRSGTP